LNKTLTFTLTLAFLSASCMVFVEPAWAATENSWTQKAPMNEARGLLGVATVNGKIYAIGGDQGTYYGYVALGGSVGNFSGTNEEYDPSLDQWTFKAPMPTPRCNFDIAVYENKIYCIGGMGRNASSSELKGANEVYDPATNTWETKSPMPTPRYQMQAHVVNGKIYLIGGSYPSMSLKYNINEVYDPETDTWTTAAPMPTGVGSYASAVVGNKIYVLEGTPSYNIAIFYNQTQIYDTEKNQWSIGTPYSKSWYKASAGATTGAYAPVRIYVFDEAATYIYDPQNDTWAEGAAIPTVRAFEGVVAVNDTFYAVGGKIMPTEPIGAMSSSPVNEQYTPFGYEISPLPSSSTSPSPSQSPTPPQSPTSSPTQFPNPTPITSPTKTLMPTSSSSPTPSENNSAPQTNVYLITASAILILVVAVGVFAFGKKKAPARN
jgi:N-acetylneuraminic acid mutarotase